MLKRGVWLRSLLFGGTPGGWAVRRGDRAFDARAFHLAVEYLVVRHERQVFAGQAVIAGRAQIKFTPVGLPGWNLTTGESAASEPQDPSPDPSTPPVVYTEADRTVVSNRIVTESN